MVLNLKPFCFVYSNMKKIFIILIILTFNLIYSHSSNYGYNIMELSNRQTLGDINEDGEINIQDVILLVNLVLNNEYDDLADLNSDSIINVFNYLNIAKCKNKNQKH